MREDVRRRKEKKAYDDFCKIPDYDPHQMIESRSYWGPTAAEQKVFRLMQKYQTKKIYNPHTGLCEEDKQMYQEDDVIKFSNAELVNSQLIGVKFLITERSLCGNVSMMSLDENEIALQLNYETVKDLGGAKVGYRRRKAIGFWASLRKDPEYEIISLADEKVNNG